jgi:hypothetical protein
MNQLKISLGWNQYYKSWKYKEWETQILEQFAN